jgi:hypothetical protein
LDVSPFVEERAAEVALEAVKVSIEKRNSEVALEATEAPTETEKIAEVATEAPEAPTEAEKRVKLDEYHGNTGFVGALGSIEAPWWGVKTGLSYVCRSENAAALADDARTDRFDVIAQIFQGTELSGNPVDVAGCYLEIAEQVSQAAGEAKESSKETASNAADKVKEGANNELNAASDMVNDVPRKTKETTQNLKEVGIEAAKAVVRRRVTGVGDDQ